MKSEQVILVSYLTILFCLTIIAQTQEPNANLSSHRSENSKKKGDNRTSFSPLIEERTSTHRIPDRIVNETSQREHRMDHFSSLSRTYDDAKYYEILPTRYTTRNDKFWFNPKESYARLNDSLRKIDHSITWPTWTSKKDIYNSNRNKKNRKSMDLLEDYLGLDSRLHESADRKYVHEHEGFFFPIHVPSHGHHEKEDHLLPLLLLILLPLLLFAIIIPLNANLLSTLFLIMQNNGAGGGSNSQMSVAGRKKRYLDTPHPFIEQNVFELLEVFDRAFAHSTNKHF